jgi:AAA15 family ATPase/GTPase
MTRVFHILLALVNAKDGFLLVDEFGNGIHWSALTKLWDTVFRVASELSVQVIATTHSKDCVTSFFEVWARHKQQGAFHRIELRGENVSAMSLSNEDLEDAIDAGVEVR